MTSLTHYIRKTFIFQKFYAWFFDIVSVMAGNIKPHRFL